MAGALILKQIHPDKLKDVEMYAALYEMADQIAKEMEFDFVITTGTWTHQVKFERLVQVGPKSIEIFVGTDDPIYGYVDEGTKPHVILPRGKNVLAFPEGFVPKSQPNVISSFKGGHFGKTIFSKGVIHPGTKPRNFSKEIQKKWKNKIRGNVEKAMRKAAERSGHFWSV
jgi:hypothetical protein